MSPVRRSARPTTCRSSSRLRSRRQGSFRSINPHYTDAHPDGHAGETREQRLLEYVEANPCMTVAGLREGCILRVENGRIELIGERPMRIFRKGQAPCEVRPGDDLNFLLD